MTLKQKYFIGQGIFGRRVNFEGANVSDSPIASDVCCNSTTCSTGIDMKQKS